MKTEKKLLIFSVIFLLIVLPSCYLDTVHQTTSTQPKMSVEEATEIMKKAVKDSITDNNVKAVRDVIVYEDGFTLINYDNTRRHYYFKDIADPVVIYSKMSSKYLVKFIEPQPLTLDYVKFGPLESANAFANALYYVKHADIKQERAKEQEESLRRIQQTTIDEKKEREKKQEESLRLIRKTPIKDESGATEDKIIPDSTTKRRKSPDRPTQPRKSVDEPPQRQPEGGSPPLPALPPGGAVSGH